MTYPSILEYDTALSDLTNSLQVTRFRSAMPQRHAKNNRFIAYTGGYSRVYKLNLVRDEYALKCWTADVPDAGMRYPQIAAYLVEVRLPYFIDFGYEPEGILVGKSLYPTLWMKWASGQTLCPFIDKYIDQPDILIATARAFRHMMSKLHTSRIAHGDLQDGNIIADVKGAWVELTLIDYDSMAVPALFGLPASISGQSNYQSPHRDNLPEMNERLDHFSELVIYLSLLAYAEKPALWLEEQDKRLLFEAADFAAPGKAQVWRELDGLSPSVRFLADRLRDFCKVRDLNALQSLEEVLANYAPAASNTISKSSQENAQDDWGDFLGGMTTVTPAAGPSPAQPVRDERWVMDMFETLPEVISKPKPAPAPVMNKQKVVNPSGQPASPVRQTQKTNVGASVMAFSGLFVLFFAVILVMFSGTETGFVVFYLLLISVGVFILAFVVEFLRGIFR